MSLHNYSDGNRGKTRKKRSKLIPVLVTLAVILVLAIALMICFLISNEKSDRELRKLAEQVQAYTTAPEETTPSSAATEAVEMIPETSMVMETEPTVLPQYAQLYEKNNEMFGWILIEDTAIDYPVMHTPEDPEKYLHSDFNGAYSYPGVPFVDAACQPDSDNLLIYAHNMPNGSMFRSLLRYEQKDYWKAHPVIRFDTLYEEQEFEVVAAFYDRVYYKNENGFKFYQFIDAADEADFDNAVAQFRDKSLYDTGVDAEFGDQLITLVTCAYHTDNGRFVVVARKSA